jgi:hypothetical protein
VVDVTSVHGLRKDAIKVERAAVKDALRSKIGRSDVGAETTILES